MVTIGDIKKQIQEKEQQICKCLSKYIQCNEICSLIVEKIREPFPIFFYIDNFIKNAIDLREVENIRYAIGFSERIRKIINEKIFRFEDVEMIKWNSKILGAVTKFVSGSTYTSDGNLKLFQKSIIEIEEKILYYQYNYLTFH